MKLRFSEGGTADRNLDDVIGRTCVSGRELGNGHFRAPPGTRFKIRHARPGFSLEFVDACATCGVYIRISRVDYRDVIIDGLPPAKSTRTKRSGGGR